MIEREYLIPYKFVSIFILYIIIKLIYYLVIKIWFVWFVTGLAYWLLFGL